MSDSNKIKVCAVQAEPGWFDLDASVKKTVSLIKSAADQGVKVIGFPELFVPGYPWRLWTDGYDGEYFLKYQKASMSTTSDAYATLRKAAKDNDIWVVFGFPEFDKGSLYIAQSFIDPHGEVALHRRKIKPTGHERTFWGDGQAESLTSVVDTGSFRLGGLNCWEHMQTLLRYHHYSLGVQIHVGGWPPLYSYKESALPHHFSSETNGMVTQFLATEGQSFALCTTQVLTQAGLAKCFMEDHPEFVGGGFGAIYGPQGQQITKPTNPNEEILLIADIDLDDILRAKQQADPVGHYSRPDMLSLNVNTKPADKVRYFNENGPIDAGTLTTRIPKASQIFGKTVQANGKKA